MQAHMKIFIIDEFNESELQILKCNVERKRSNNSKIIRNKSIENCF